jgi:hypothetical protein
MKRKRIIRLGLISILLAVNILVFGNSNSQSFQAERCNWSDITCNPDLKEYTKAIAEEAWGQAGIVAYQAAAQWMRANNGSTQELDNIQKQHLRPFFGDLVDRVAIAYNARLMDDWLYAGFKIDIGQVDSVAQTYCDRIYIERSYKPNDPGQLTLLAHELMHSRQCEQFGGVGKFGYYYFREFKKAGQSYENNKLEREANDFERQFAGWLSHQLANNEAAPEQG